MKQIIFLLLLWPAILLSQNRIDWSENQKLKFEDFKAEAPNSGIMQTASGSFFVGYEMQNLVILMSRNLNKYVYCYFLPEVSYMDSGDSASISSLLRYQQLQFDLNEVNARLLRKKFYDNRKLLLSHGAQGLQEELTQEHAKLLSMIEKDTKHGNDLDQVYFWEIKIQDMLSELSDFKAEGKPKKSR